VLIVDINPLALLVYGSMLAAYSALSVISAYAVSRQRLVSVWQRCHLMLSDSYWLVQEELIS